MKNLLIIGTLLLSMNSFAGNEKGNGGFLYSRTSKKLLDASQASLLTELDSVLKNRKELIYTSSACSKPVDLRELNSIVSELTYNYEVESVGTNPEGKEEKRYFHINTENKVEATELYFSSFVDTYFRYSEEKDSVKKQSMIAPIRTAIVHESLHLLDYNELDSRDCSNDLVKLLESHNDLQLSQLRKQIQLENASKVKSELFKSGCLNEKQNIALKNASSEMVRMSISQDIVKCVSTKFINLQSETPNTHWTDIQIELINSFDKTGSIFDASYVLNKGIKFPFEKELPTKL